MFRDSYIADEYYDHNYEDTYSQQVAIDLEPCILTLLWTPTEQLEDTLRDIHIREGEGIVLIYSITSRSSFEQLSKFYGQIQTARQTLPGNIRTVPMILVGNKSDETTERQVSTQDGWVLAKQWACEFVEVSAKRATNVEQAFFDIVRLMRQHRRYQRKKEANCQTGSKCYLL